MTCGLRNRCSTTELLWRCANCGRGISGAPRALASAFTRLSRDFHATIAVRAAAGRSAAARNRSLESLRLRHPAQGRLASCMDTPNPAAEGNSHPPAANPRKRPKRLLIQGEQSRVKRRCRHAALRRSASPDASVTLCRPPRKGRPGTDRTTGGAGRLGGDSRRLPRRGETSGSERVIMEAEAISHIPRSGNVPKITQPQIQPTGRPRQYIARPKPKHPPKTNNPTQFTQLPS